MSQKDPRLPSIKEVGRQEYMRIYNKIYVEKNKEKEIERWRVYAESHREQAREAARKRYWENPEQRRKAALDYAKAHPEKIAKRMRRWKVENREKVIRQRTAWRAANRDRIRAMPSRSWKNTPHEPAKVGARQAVSLAVRARTLLKQACVYCGDQRVEAHHDSYARNHWLDVRWLCKLQHAAWHRVFLAEG